MASGDTLGSFTVHANEPPASNYATFDTRNGHPLLDFDAGADEVAIFSDVLPRHYGGGGITAYLHFAMSTATSGNVVLGGSFERIGDGQHDIDSDGFATEKTATVAVPATSGNIEIASIAFSNGSEIDSIAVGEGFRFKFRRVGTNGSDTATGDLELRWIEFKET